NVTPETDEANNTLATGLDSQYQPKQDWLPVVQWFSGLTDPYISAMPVVAPLIDTNGDGQINERDVPAVLVNSGTASPSTRLTALRGDTGQGIFSIPYSVPVDAQAAPGVGDVDADGRPEIFLKGFVSGTLYAFNNDGSLKWTSQKVTDSSTSPVLVDLDGDGKSEILFGGAVLNFDGTKRWEKRGYGGVVGLT